MIVCLTTRLRKSHDHEEGLPMPKQGILLLNAMADQRSSLDDYEGIWKTLETILIFLD